jgi:hypothetical protein
MSDAGLHQLVHTFLLKNLNMDQLTSPLIDSYASAPSPEAAVSSPLNPNVLFPTPPITHVAVAVAVDWNTSVEVPATPTEVHTRNEEEEEEATTINKQRSCKCKARVSMSEPTDILEKDAFDYTRNGLPRKKWKSWTDG